MMQLKESHFSEMFKSCLNDAKNNKVNIVLATLLMGIFLIPEVYAFSTPIVEKTNAITGHLVKIAGSTALIGLIYFVYTLFTGQPAWKTLGCVLLGTAILISWSVLTSWLRTMN